MNHLEGRLIGVLNSEVRLIISPFVFRWLFLLLAGGVNRFEARAVGRARPLAGS